MEFVLGQMWRYWWFRVQASIGAAVSQTKVRVGYTFCTFIPLGLS